MKQLRYTLVVFFKIHFFNKAIRRNDFINFGDSYFCFIKNLILDTKTPCFKILKTLKSALEIILEVDCFKAYWMNQ